MSNPYLGLRDQILTLDPAEAGLDQEHTGPIWGAMMETGYGADTVSLVCLADGTTSLYTSTGGGIIGGGAHPQVVAATADFLGALLEFLPELVLEDEPKLPTDGQVILRALTHVAAFTQTASEDDLGYGRSPFSPAFHAAHEVITQLRLTQERD